ncbi:hypothetical protein GH865_10245 [Rhodocyclus tenuis]|uniref:hypothetical protein n=1 Tax=Rhodocyclus gracilis TaxID=2929842 RepID=UPI001298DEAD|nr:hypothetical protein [Rhodocyclus gracilis]MRD73629.1 hypothetical protein [Rhodocyclus gracilis]
MVKQKMPLTPADVQKNLQALAPCSNQRIEQLLGIERQAFASYKGQFDELEAALGMLHLGDHLGWKPLVLIHNKRTIRKYEEILGINVREFFPEEGPSAHRSLGYRIAKKLGNFWKAVSGEVKDEELKASRRVVE